MSATPSLENSAYRAWLRGISSDDFDATATLEHYSGLYVVTRAFLRLTQLVDAHVFSGEAMAASGYDQVRDVKSVRLHVMDAGPTFTMHMDHPERTEDELWDTYLSAGALASLHSGSLHFENVAKVAENNDQESLRGNRVTQTEISTTLTSSTHRSVRQSIAWASAQHDGEFGPSYANDRENLTVGDLYGLGVLVLTDMPNVD